MRVTTAKAGDRSNGLLDAFLEAAADPVRDGADGITTSCGFLSVYQQELAAHVEVPVAASSLMQIPLVQRTLPPGRRVGVLTYMESRLGPEHLQAAGAQQDTPVVGTESGREFWRVMGRGEMEHDIAAAARTSWTPGATSSASIRRWAR
ncbi:MAG: hypothetical protein JOZ05_14210 [Acetobacteraceae bacterium]|nr:hypothetical protein [Acetobacteraceae bacterium]